MTRPPPRIDLFAGWDRIRREQLEAEKRTRTPEPANPYWEAMQRAMQLARRVAELKRAEWAENQARMTPAEFAQWERDTQARAAAPPRMVTHEQAWNEVDLEWKQAVRDGRVRAEAEFGRTPMPAPSKSIAELTEAVLSSKAGGRLGLFWHKIAPHMDAKVTNEGPFPHLGAACKFARSMGDLDRKAVAHGIETHFPHWYIAD